MNIFGRIRDKVSGPERTFEVLSIKRGEETVGKVYGTTTCSWVSGMYSREVPVRLVSIKLKIDGTEYSIDTSEVLEFVNPLEVVDGVSSRQLERLERLRGEQIIIREKEPYDSGTLRKLANIGR